MLTSGRRSTAVSVTSRQIALAGTPLSRSARSTTATKSICASWRAETLTETQRSRPWARHAASWRQDSSRTQAPIGTIGPSSSAMRRNSPGSSSPRSGWSQRSSASQPIGMPSAIATSGWKTTRSSPRCSAPRSWAASSRRWRTSAASAASKTSAVATTALALGPAQRDVGVADRSSASMPGTRATATPTLPVTVTRPLRVGIGRANAP